MRRAASVGALLFVLATVAAWAFASGRYWSWTSSSPVQADEVAALVRCAAPDAHLTRRALVQDLDVPCPPGWWTEHAPTAGVGPWISWLSRQANDPTLPARRRGRAALLLVPWAGDVVPTLGAIVRKVDPDLREALLERAPKTLVDPALRDVVSRATWARAGEAPHDAAHLLWRQRWGWTWPQPDVIPLVLARRPELDPPGPRFAGGVRWGEAVLTEAQTLGGCREVGPCLDAVVQRLEARERAHPVVPSGPRATDWLRLAWGDDARQMEEGGWWLAEWAGWFRVVGRIDVVADTLSGAAVNAESRRLGPLGVLRDGGGGGWAIAAAIMLVGEAAGVDVPIRRAGDVLVAGVGDDQAAWDLCGRWAAPVDGAPVAWADIVRGAVTEAAAADDPYWTGVAARLSGGNLDGAAGVKVGQLVHHNARRPPPDICR